MTETTIRIIKFISIINIIICSWIIINQHFKIRIGISLMISRKNKSKEKEELDLTDALPVIYRKLESIRNGLPDELIYQACDEIQETEITAYSKARVKYFLQRYGDEYDFLTSSDENDIVKVVYDVMNDDSHNVTSTKEWDDIIRNEIESYQCHE